MKTLILVAGAPRSGKDTVAKATVEYWNEIGRTKATVISSSAELKQEAFRTLFNKELTIDELELNKDVKRDDLGGVSWREHCIRTAEQGKRTKGNAHWTKLTLAEINKAFATNDVVLLTGVGFYDEVSYILQHYKTIPVDIYGIHILRNGYTYANDSRRFIMDALDPGMWTIVVNDGTVHDMVLALDRTIYD